MSANLVQENRDIMFNNLAQSQIQSCGVKNIRYLAVIVLGIIIDQYAKFYAMQSLIFGKPQGVVPYFNWSLNYNKGIAFGLLSQYETLVQIGLIGMVIAMIIAMTLWLRILINERSSWQAFSVALIIAGAIGNVIDRIRLGHVVDFIDFYIGNWHWPTFNIADSFICIGAAILALTIICCTAKK